MNIKIFIDVHIFYNYILKSRKLKYVGRATRHNTIQYNNDICRALFTKRPGALTETSDDMLCEIVQSLNGA